MGRVRALNREAVEQCVSHLGLLALSELDGLTVDDGAESLAMLDCLLALTVQVVLFAADLHREEIALLKGLDQLLLMLKLAHIADLACPGAANARRDSNLFTVAVQLYLSDRGGHDHRRLVHPVEGEGSSEDFRVEAEVVHVVPNPDTTDTHAAFEGKSLDLVRHEATLLDISRVKHSSSVTLEFHWVLKLMQECIIK